MKSSPQSGSTLTRRKFLVAAGAVATGPIMASCSSGQSNGSKEKPLIFWDMPWGTPEFNTEAAKVVAGFKQQATKYQTIQWANFNQTFASAIASKTGPAVSGGGAFQAFQYAADGSIAYADNVIATMKQNGDYEDFLPGVIDEMKVEAGYVAVPWQADIRPMWYRKSLLEKAGASVPTDWDSFLTAAKALKKIHVYGFGTGAGPGNNMGPQAMVSWMINNAGGWFDKDGHPDCVTDRNIEAMEYIHELVATGITDPGAVSYTGDNLLSQWKGRHIGMGIHTPSLNVSIGDTDDDVLVTEPLMGPHGDKGTMRSINNLMMYKNTPSQAGSEALLIYYLDQMKTFWDMKLVSSVPIRKSIIASPAIQQGNSQMLKVINAWAPIGKPQAAIGTTLFSGLAALDGNQQIQQFAQRMLEGKTSAKSALEIVQTQLSKVIK